MTDAMATHTHHFPSCVLEHPSLLPLLIYRFLLLFRLLLSPFDGLRLSLGLRQELGLKKGRGVKKRRSQVKGQVQSKRGGFKLKRC